MMGMAKSRGDSLEGTKSLMAALGRMPPRQHKDMKLGKRSAPKAKSPAKRGASAKPKTA
jgi:hypothetical protein